MYVCICNAITESQITKARSQGFTTMSQITDHLGVGDCCGQCIPEAKTLLNDKLLNGSLLNDNKVHKYTPVLLNEPVLAAI